MVSYTSTQKGLSDAKQLVADFDHILANVDSVYAPRSVLYSRIFHSGNSPGYLGHDSIHTAVVFSGLPSTCNDHCLQDYLVAMRLFFIDETNMISHTGRWRISI